MANYAQPLINTAYITYVGLVSQADTNILQASPTIAAGDFKVSIDGGAFANLATLPTVTPAAGTAVKISLSAGEMNGANIVVACIDAAGAEWCDQLINIPTVPSDLITTVGAAGAGLTAVGLAATGLDLVLMSDLAAVPTATASIKAALNWLFMLGRNKRTQTATTETVYRDDASTSAATSTKADDGTTFTRNEYS